MKFKILPAGLALFALFAHLMHPGVASARGTKSAGKMSPLQLIRSGRYVQAFPAIKKMQAANPGDVSLNYYLGVCAVSVGDINLAEASFCRVVVASLANSAFVPLAKQQLLTLPHRYVPQCALSNGSLYRWRTGAQIRIYVSDGRLIPGTGTDLLPPAQFGKTVAMARNTMAKLPISRAYQPGEDRFVKAGIRAWDWAVAEKLFTYTFVADPRSADIIILWADVSQGFTMYPYVSGQPVLVWAPAAPSSKFETRERHIKLIAAHEFGHALGLTHSRDKADLMLAVLDNESFSHRTAPEQFASENDRASLRALYSLPPTRYF